MQPLSLPVQLTPSLCSSASRRWRLPPIPQGCLSARFTSNDNLLSVGSPSDITLRGGRLAAGSLNSEWAGRQQPRDSKRRFCLAARHHPSPPPLLFKRGKTSTSNLGVSDHEKAAVQMNQVSRESLINIDTPASSAKAMESGFFTSPERIENSSSKLGISSPQLTGSRAQNYLHPILSRPPSPPLLTRAVQSLHPYWLSPCQRKLSIFLELMESPLGALQWLWAHQGILTLPLISASLLVFRTNVLLPSFTIGYIWLAWILSGACLVNYIEFIRKFSHFKMHIWTSRQPIVSPLSASLKDYQPTSHSTVWLNPRSTTHVLVHQSIRSQRSKPEAYQTSVVSTLIVFLPSINGCRGWCG